MLADAVFELLRLTGRLASGGQVAEDDVGTVEVCSNVIERVAGELRWRGRIAGRMASAMVTASREDRRAAARQAGDELEIMLRLLADAPRQERDQAESRRALH